MKVDLVLMKEYLDQLLKVILIQSLICNGSYSESRSIMLTQSSAGIVPVCPGEDLHFICSTNRSFIEWNITVQPESDEKQSRTKFISDISPLATIIVNGKNFSIARNSSSGFRPLTSTASVANVTADLNGTIVNCTSIEHSPLEIGSSVTTIHVIRTDDSQPNPPGPITTHVTRYTADNILVMLDWTPEDGVSYNVTIFPQVAVVFNASTSVHLILRYNTQYNVNILANLCGKSDTIIVFHHVLKFAKCSYDPFAEQLEVHVMVNGDLALEGTIVTFSCPPGLVLVGANTSTCMENGQWNPDHANVECKADCGTPILKDDCSIYLMYNSTLEESQLIFWCKKSPNNVFTALCYRNASWYPNPADVECSNNIILPENGTVATVSGPASSFNTVTTIIAAILSPLTPFIIMVYVIGFLSGCFCQKHRKSYRHPSNDGETNQTSNEITPIYEDGLLSTDKTAGTVQHQEEQSLDMTKNVAYGPLKPLALAHTDTL